MALPEGAKCLLFSQWDEMLSLLAKALEANGVSHRRLQGAQRLESTLDDFRRVPTVRALLLPTRSGANGLNLVEAQHVMLVEPLLNTAVEAQAVGRVHRMSQRHATTVHRFVVENTIEAAILGLRGQAHDGQGSNAAAAGPGASSPSKRARHADETKSLSWEQVQALFGLCEGGEGGEGGEGAPIDVEMASDTPVVPVDR